MNLIAKTHQTIAPQVADRIEDDIRAIDRHASLNVRNVEGNAIRGWVEHDRDGEADQPDRKRVDADVLKMLRTKWPSFEWE